MDITTIRDSKMRQFIETQIASVPPVNSEFVQGDIVTVTNGYGIKIPGKQIIGFVPEINPDFRPESFIYLNWDCYWFSKAPDELTFERRDANQAFSPEQLESLWNHLSDVLVDNDGHLEVSWRHFQVGTHREEVWSWFESLHPNISVAALMGLVDP